MGVYIFSKQAKAELDRIDENISSRLYDRIMALPDFCAFTELSGRHVGQCLLRVDDWRVVFMLKDDKVLVGSVLPPFEGAGIVHTQADRSPANSPTRKIVGKAKNNGVVKKKRRAGRVR